MISRPHRHATILGLALTVLAGACATRTAGAADRPAAASAGATAPDPAGKPAGESNVRFMRDMIAHHRQALDMSALAERNAADPAIRTLARRIDASQTAEIARMQRWLATRNHDTTATAGHHAGRAMPGMLSDREMAGLAAVTGPAFDRLFVESMVRHHEGALVMVAELMDAGGGRDDLELFQLASQIDADQRAEIERMRRLLAQLR